MPFPAHTPSPGGRGGQRGSGHQRPRESATGSPRRGGPLVASAPHPATDPSEAPGGPLPGGRLSPQRGGLQDRARPYLTHPLPRLLRRLSLLFLLLAPGAQSPARREGSGRAGGEGERSARAPWWPGRESGGPASGQASRISLWMEGSGRVWTPEEVQLSRGIT